MKIQCDVCSKAEATVYCSADEAALCSACDHRVHHANKLAGKHPRLSLHYPSTKQPPPLCDICQERRAFVFCQQDRAILCRECDGSIHDSNELTKKHHRFLLTGVKVSEIKNEDSIGVKSQGFVKKSVSVSPESSKIGKKAEIIDRGDGTSSISEYLIETLPGWHVEDFLDSSSVPFGFSKNVDDLSPFVDTDLESDLSCFSPENLGVWVPQAPSVMPDPSLIGGEVHGFKETKQTSRTWMMMSDDVFTVPQISPPLLKRSRNFW